MADNILAGNIHIVSLLSFGRRCNYWTGKFLIILHTLRHNFSTQLPPPRMILPQCMPCQIPPDHHLNPYRFTQHSNRHIRMRHRHFPVRDNIPGGIQKITGQLIQHLSLVRNRPRKDMIKSRNTVCSHRHHCIVYVVNIPDFPAIKSCLSRQGEIGG